jgi:high-affinity Fe2+/Pb2+ permease
MKRILQMISLAGLILTILPSILFFLGEISHSTQNSWTLAGTILWFISAVFWLGGKEKVADK